MERVGSIVGRVLPDVAPLRPMEVPGGLGPVDAPTPPYTDPDSYDRFFAKAAMLYRKTYRRRICTVSPDGVFEERLNPWV